jgi:hypothetical protein
MHEWTNRLKMMGDGSTKSAVDLVSRSSNFSQTAFASCIVAWMSMSIGRRCSRAHLKLATFSDISSVYTVQNEMGSEEERYGGGVTGTGASRRNGIATDKIGIVADFDSKLHFAKET